MRAVSERSSHPFRSLGFDSEMATQAYVLAYSRSDVDCRHIELDSADSARLADELERCPEQLIGKYDVVGAAADPNQLQVLSRQSQQAVRSRSSFGRPAAGGALRLSDDAFDASEPLVHLVLPGREDVGVLDSVTGHAGRLAGHLDLFVSFNFPRQAVAAST
jgi:hypothetical protein